MSRPLRVGVIGSASVDPEAAEVAHRVGRAIAESGAVLVCGGLGGAMAAAARGAAAAGGTVVGFLPGDDPGAAAPEVTLPFATGLGEARNVLVVRASEAVLAVAGGWGTLSEAAFCLKLGVGLVGVRDRLPPELPIERFQEPAAAVARALEIAREARVAGGVGHGR